MFVILTSFCYNANDLHMKLTKKRAQILDLLKAHSGALSAAAVHQQLPNIDLVTIYRNLDLFVQKKLIKKINFSAAAALYEFQHEPHHHALCNDCAKVIHFTAPDAEILQLLKLKDFQVSEIEVTVKGVCRR